MSKQTYEKDGLKIEIASDLDDLVVDKRKSWRANSSKANQRQRRYKKRLTKQIIQIDKDSLT
ncbi:MAG: hypothetical protein ISQ95_04280 [Flavobacteriales bacterium]|nr:hypothetical protein [Flavobacteriales bacterium]